VGGGRFAQGLRWGFHRPAIAPPLRPPAIAPATAE